MVLSSQWKPGSTGSENQEEPEGKHPEPQPGKLTPGKDAQAHRGRIIFLATPFFNPRHTFGMGLHINERKQGHCSGKGPFLVILTCGQDDIKPASRLDYIKKGERGGGETETDRQTLTLSGKEVPAGNPRSWKSKTGAAI